MIHGSLFLIEKLCSHNFIPFIYFLTGLSISGEREGLYSWVVLNQLLDRQIDPQLTNRFINSPRTGPLKGKSVALIELGGASAQVVLQPPVSPLLK